MKFKTFILIMSNINNKKDNIHFILEKLGDNRPFILDLNYKQITKEFDDQLSFLYEEFSRRNIKEKYFKNLIFNEPNNNFSLGAFLTINSKEYLIGFIIGNITNNEEFTKLFPNLENEIENKADKKELANEYGFLLYIGVIDEYRRIKIGTKLMDLFIEKLTQKKIKYIYLEVDDQNLGARIFFEKNKWQCCNDSNSFNFQNKKILKYLFVIDNTLLPYPGDDSSDESFNKKNIQRNLNIMLLCSFFLYLKFLLNFLNY